MLKVSQNPPQRWPEERSLYEDCGNWWVVYTKPHNEKALAWDLQKLGVGYYLPMTTKRTRRLDNGKPRKSLICLFPGYVSLVNYKNHKNSLLKTGRIVRAFEINNQERFVQELDQISRVTRQNVDIEIHDDLVIGQSVYIVSGPLKGIEGTIDDIIKCKRVFLNVEMFSRSVSIQVDPAILIPLS